MTALISVIRWQFMIQLPVVLSFLGFLTVVIPRPIGRSEWVFDLVASTLGFFVWALAQLFRRQFFRAQHVMVNQNQNSSEAMIGATLLVLVSTYVVILLLAVTSQRLQTVPSSYVVASYVPVLVFNLIAGDML